MKEKIFHVNYIIDGILSVIPTKMIFEQLNEDEIQSIHFELDLGNRQFVSNSSDVTELAIVNFQQILPSNINIACCESCRHGNFCPFGDNDNEVFCFKDLSFSNKMDVCDFFNNNYPEDRIRKLLDYCTDYKSITNEYYTYNDWGL